MSGDAWERSHALPLFCMPNLQRDIFLYIIIGRKKKMIQNIC